MNFLKKVCNSPVTQGILSFLKKLVNSKGFELFLKSFAYSAATVAFVGFMYFGVGGLFFQTTGQSPLIPLVALIAIVLFAYRQQ